MKPPQRVLIVKTGFSEFLDRGVSSTVSLGDVLMCTALLPVFAQDHVTWVTAPEAEPLLRRNPFVDRLLLIGPETFPLLMSQAYDVIINLEKERSLCAFLQGLKTRDRYGFVFDETRRRVGTSRKSVRFLLAGQENQGDIDRNFFEILYETVGKTWRGEQPILVVPGRPETRWDIGLNYEVGPKWPTKAWPKERWERLAQELSSEFRVSWQEGFDDCDAYGQWIRQCRLIVSCDSLGQLIGSLCGRPVISLFGPTDHRRLSGLRSLTAVVSSSDCPHRPCYLPFCVHHDFCMNHITVSQVADLCRTLLHHTPSLSQAAADTSAARSFPRS